MLFISNQKNKYHDSPFERGVEVCFQSNRVYFFDLISINRIDSIAMY